MIPFEEIKQKALQDLEVKAEYEKLEDEFRLISMMIQARLEAKLTKRASS